MTKALFICLTLMLLVLPARGNLRIVTTTTDYADLARQIGGERVDVHSVMKGPENLHNVLAKPTEMVFLNRADLFVHSGLDAEPWRDNLLRGARNPRVAPGKPGNVDMSVGIELKDVPEGAVDRSMGDVHAYGSPHFSLHPQNMQRKAATLVKAMADADPGNADHYKQNAVKLVRELGDVARAMRDEMRPYAGLKVVTFHKGAWTYFADAVPIDIVGTIEPQPSITPSAEQVRRIVKLMKEQDVKVVICETYNDSRLARYVADQAGARMIVLPDHVLGVPEADSCQNLLRYNVQKLIAAAADAGVQPREPAQPAARATPTPAAEGAHNAR